MTAAEKLIDEPTAEHDELKDSRILKLSRDRYVALDDYIKLEIDKKIEYSLHKPMVCEIENIYKESSGNYRLLQYAGESKVESVRAWALEQPEIFRPNLENDESEYIRARSLELGNYRIFSELEVFKTSSHIERLALVRSSLFVEFTEQLFDPDFDLGITLTERAELLNAYICDNKDVVSSEDYELTHPNWTTLLALSRKDPKLWVQVAQSIYHYFPLHGKDLFESYESENKYLKDDIITRAALSNNNPYCRKTLDMALQQREDETWIICKYPFNDDQVKDLLDKGDTGTIYSLEKNPFLSINAYKLIVAYLRKETEFNRANYVQNFIKQKTKSNEINAPSEVELLQNELNNGLNSVFKFLVAIILILFLILSVNYR